MRTQLDWDAENRLVRVAPESGREQTGDVKVEFEYDYRNRRVARRVYTWDGAEWDLTAGRKYVWDGWRLLLELDVSGETLTVLRAYTWGLDLAGQAGGPGGAGILPARPTAAGLLEGAGTIGGLLAVYDTYGTTSTGDDVRYVYLYDGNGNVGQLIDPVPGTYSTALFKARYEYDPYGTVVQKSGAYALGNRNPFQFSTKQFDAETGMGYWGERYYLPDVGRWANRDPIEEAGGVNLYAYVMNEPVGSVDEIGLYLSACRIGSTCPWQQVSGAGPASQPTAPSTAAGARAAPVRIVRATEFADSSAVLLPSAVALTNFWDTVSCMGCLARVGATQRITGSGPGTIANIMIGAVCPMPPPADPLGCECDALQHCVGSALLAGECGSSCAMWGGYILEEQQGNPSVRDNNNNAIGAVGCASTNPGTAFNCCMQLLANGALDTARDPSDNAHSDGRCH